MRYDLSRLGSENFERLCQALAIKILGPAVRVFGAGPDGGREAAFEGVLKYPDPSPDGLWTGYGILQAKYKKVLSRGTGDVRWLRTRLKLELDAWADPTKRRVQNGRPPQYLIVATNVSLSSVPGKGGKDRIDEFIAQYADQIGVKAWRVWDEDQITSFLDVHEDIARSFAALITPDAVLAALYDSVSTPTAEVSERFRLGEGLPGTEMAFRAAYDAAGGPMRLGQPAGPAYEDGPGFVQWLSKPDGTTSGVICALPRHPAVVVADPVWSAINRVGDPAHGGGIDGIGYPAPDSGGPRRYIGPEAQSIELSGGHWGPGALVRRSAEQWIWAPAVRLDPNASLDRDVWTGEGAIMDLRLRVAARIPWLSDHLRVDAAGHRRTGRGRCRRDAPRPRAA